MTEKLKVLDLFSGIGGFSLGLDRTGGFETAAFCEIEPFPRAVLAKHWPEKICYDDVRTLNADRLASDGVAVDFICGGFPCQDISAAGRMAGMGEGTRSGLFQEIMRLVDELRPKYILLENVANLLAGPAERPGEWFAVVLSGLAQRGYDAEWENIPASALGFEHGRERVWIVAYPSGRGLSGVLSKHRIAKAIGRLTRERGKDQFRPEIRTEALGRLESDRERPVQPRLGGRSDGLSARVVRGGMKGFGNSVIPDIAELIGYAILDAESA
jgi:DNA (cytosine-5)-methyltransferase 1